MRQYSHTYHILKACFAFLLLITFFSCSDEKSGAKEEGFIEFDTKAVDETHPLYGFAPSTATFKFKGPKFIMEMSTMGMFNTSIIGDNQTKTLVQTIKFMNIKQACIENEKDITNDNLNFPLKIEETGETKEILGFKCYKAKVTLTSAPTENFDVWYTKELGMEDCNALTPYAPIKGVLLDYRIKKMGMELHFQAKSYKNIEIQDKEFEIPASMKIVPVEEMAKFFTDLQ